MQLAEHLYAQVKVENEPTHVIVPISSGKPNIPESIQMKWQKIVDLIARIMNVPTGLITRLTVENLEIFVASNNIKNPYHKDDKDKLGIGMFCETVAGKRREMMVTDTEKSDFWRNNPHAQFGMHAYLGVPIEWKDGEIFGTLCMLDDKANPYSEEFQDLIRQFKEIIETDLDNLVLQEQLEKRLSAQEMQIREAHHRIRNHFNLLISFLRLQSKKLHDEQDMQMILMELESRIKTVSLIHEKLYKTSGAQKIPLDQYIQELCDYIVHNLSDQKITIHYHIDPVKMTPKLSVPCGIIVSELVTNSLKHAFEGIKDPEIAIQIKQSAFDKITINYQDNGIGLPGDFNIESTDSLGMSLIKMSTQQLEGEIKIPKTDHAEFQITLCSKE